MSGYNRSCSRADSSILLAAQCAAALSMMPASALSCWAQGVTAASYKEYAIWVSPPGGIGETMVTTIDAIAYDRGRLPHCHEARIVLCACRRLDVHLELRQGFRIGEPSLA